MSASNSQWASNLTLQVNGVQTCADLAALAAQIQSILDTQLTDVATQIAQLALLQTAPTTLPQVVSYLANLVSGYQAQYAKALAAQTALLAAQAQLTAVLSAKSISLGCS